MSLPLSLGIAGTDVSRDNNEGAILLVRVGKNKGREPGDENASCSELQSLQLPGVH